MKKSISFIFCLVMVLSFMPIVRAQNLPIFAIQPQYDFASQFTEGLAAVKIGGKWGFIDRTGKEVIKAQYSFVKDFREGMAIVQVDKKWGVVDKTGKEVVKPQYDNISDYKEGFALFKPATEGWKYGFLDKTGKEVISPIYDYAESFSGGLALVGGRGVQGGGGSDTKYGYIDQRGNEVVGLQYGDSRSFHDGLAAVRGVNGNWGFIDNTGREVIKPNYFLTYEGFSEGLAFVRTVPKSGRSETIAIDKTGKEIFKLDESLHPSLRGANSFGGYFSEGLLLVESKGKYGYIDKTGKLIVEPKYDQAFDYKNGLAMVAIGEPLNDKYGYINRVGVEVVTPRYPRAGDFSEGLAYVCIGDTRSSTCDFIDMTGKPIFNFNYPITSNWSFSEGLAAIAVNGKFGYISNPLTSKVEIDALQSITLSKDSVELSVGQSAQLSLIATYSDGSTKDVTQNASWESSSKDIFIVTDEGKITAISTETASSATAILYVSFQNKKITSKIRVIKVSQQVLPENKYPELTNQPEMEAQKPGADKAPKPTPDSEQPIMNQPKLDIQLIQGEARIKVTGSNNSYITINNIIHIEGNEGNEMFLVKAPVTITFHGNDLVFKNIATIPDYGRVQMIGNYAIITSPGDYGIYTAPQGTNSTAVHIHVIKAGEESLFEVKPERVSAKPTASKVLVNGKEISFEAYNINGNNFFKLRDIAMAVNGTDKNFEVGFDSTKNAISLESRKAYTLAGGELAVSDKPTSKDAKPISSKIYFDGKEVQLTAYIIGGNNYFKLRDITKVMNIGITFDSNTSTIGIDTNLNYKE